MRGTRACCTSTNPPDLPSPVAEWRLVAGFAALNLATTRHSAGWAGPVSGAGGTAEKFALVPPASKPELRLEWLRERWDRRQSAEARNNRAALIQWYGEEKGKAVRYAEAFEICEYGRQPGVKDIKKLFPFLPE